MSCLAWSTQFGRNLFKSVLSDVTADRAICKKLKKVFQLLEGWVRVTIKHFLTQLFSTCSTLILKHLSAVLSKSKVFVLKSVRVWWSSKKYQCCKLIWINVTVKLERKAVTKKEMDRKETRIVCVEEKRTCDSPLAPLITDREDSVEFCCKFLLPQCWVCRMHSLLYYSPQRCSHHSHTHSHTEQQPHAIFILLLLPADVILLPPNNMSSC